MGSAKVEREKDLVEKMKLVLVGALKTFRTAQKSIQSITRFNQCMRSNHMKDADVAKLGDIANKNKDGTKNENDLAISSFLLKFYRNSKSSLFAININYKGKKCLGNSLTGEDICVYSD